ncbi:hypothetical protein GTR02_09775 [Kineococcus sp. R8]|uniref:hypothetical protein n=1 Tax=Kineococcus siccus TaxID=2696567 RepID=UPI001412C62B|nr:hypothetical protein [Kineococcus siccus]NAZ82105.1 hypothetical protein [Kineococcus siccus]
MPTRAPVTPLRYYRFLVLGYSVFLACLVITVIDRAMRAQWWWFVGSVVLMVWAAVMLVTTVRHRRPRSATQQVARTRATGEASAQAEWDPSRLRDLAADRGLDLSTSAGRMALINALRESDERLGLVAAKYLVDRVS